MHAQSPAELDHSLEMGCTSYFAHLPCLLDTCSGHDVIIGKLTRIVVYVLPHSLESIKY